MINCILFPYLPDRCDTVPTPGPQGMSLHRAKQEDMSKQKQYVTQLKHIVPMNITSKQSLKETLPYQETHKVETTFGESTQS